MLENDESDAVAAALARKAGERIRARRGAKGWTQAKLALEARVDRVTVVRVEAGETGTALRVLVRLCRALGIDVRKALAK